MTETTFSRTLKFQNMWCYKTDIAFAIRSLEDEYLGNIAIPWIFKTLKLNFPKLSRASSNSNTCSHQVFIGCRSASHSAVFHSYDLHVDGDKFKEFWPTTRQVHYEQLGVCNMLSLPQHGHHETMKSFDIHFSHIHRVIETINLSISGGGWQDIWPVSLVKRL